MKWNTEVKKLFGETVIRYPHQKLEPETEKAYMQDWRDECDRVGFQRFSEGVKLARSISDFFPMIAKIKKCIPEPRCENQEHRRMMADLQQRKRDGEKFYTLADVMLEFCRRVESGKVKASTERGLAALETWAKNLRGSEKRYAARLLAADAERKRPKSDFQSAHEALLKTPK